MPFPTTPPSSVSAQTLVGLVLRFTGLAMQLITASLAARSMGAGAFGGYVLAHTLVVLTGGAASWGQAELALRLAPQASFDGARYLLINITKAVLLTCTAAASVIGVFTLLVPDTLAVTPQILVVFCLFHAVSATSAALLSAMNRVRLAQLTDGLIRPALTLLGLVACFWTGTSVSPDTIVTLSAGAAVVAAATMIMVLSRVLRMHNWHHGPAKPPSITCGLPLLASSWSGLLLSQIDLLLIGAFLGEAALGVYRVANRAAQLVGVVQQISAQVLGPRLAAALASQKLRLAGALLRNSALTATSAGAGLAVVIIALSDLYIAFLGDSFGSANVLLPILLASQVLTLPFGAAALPLILPGQEARVAATNILATASIAAGIAVLAPVGGLIFCSVVGLAVLPLQKYVLGRLSRSLIGVNPSLFPVGFLGQPSCCPKEKTEQNKHAAPNVDGQ